eukprot:15364662-Ditylum_brightwellii.AAC.1
MILCFCMGAKGAVYLGGPSHGGRCWTLSDKILKKLIQCNKNLPSASRLVLSDQRNSISSGFISDCPLPSHNIFVLVTNTQPKYPNSPVIPPSVTNHSTVSILRCVSNVAKIIGSLCECVEQYFFPFGQKLDIFFKCLRFRLLWNQPET